MKIKYDSFIDKLDDLFDISSADALHTMKIEEDKRFLIEQRKKGRVGSMLGVDWRLANREARSRLRKEKEEARELKHREALEMDSSEVEHCDPADEDIDESGPDSDSSEDENVASPQRKRRRIEKKNWITPRLCSALDKAKVDRM